MERQEWDLGSLADLPEHAVCERKAGAARVLLFRDAAGVYAVGAKCPHAGARLAEGVRHGTRIVCPWHKATFCLRTGALLEPPAVDDLPHHEVRIEGGRIKLRLASECEPAKRAGHDERCFVVIGAGAAGAVAVQSLRELGFDGRLVMLDRDNRVPYDRTLLSKYFLSGEHGDEKTPLQSQEFYRRQAIERVTADVVRIETGERLIVCGDGTRWRYDAALLAPGAVPNLPNLPGMALPGVFWLRSRRDAERLLEAAERSERAVVLGASFIGMEVAASLRERGLEVTVIGKERAPFERTLGARIGESFVGLHRKRGVELRLGCEAEAVEGDTRVQGVRLKGGEVLPADLVVIGLGVVPGTRGIEGIAKAEDGGVSVDPYLRLADGLYAAGDSARFPLYGDGDAIRVEHWRVAQQHGRAAARNMLGGEVRYDAVPVFWTIQYLKRLDYVGHAKEWDEVIVHGDLNEPAFLAYYVREGRVVAACGMDRDQETAALIELFGMRHDWTAAALGERPSLLLQREG